MGAHLMEASRDELVQAHKRVGGEAAGVVVVVGGGVKGVPLLHHEELGADFQGLVGVCHEEGGGGYFRRAGVVSSTPRGSGRGHRLAGL